MLSIGVHEGISARTVSLTRLANDADKRTEQDEEVAGRVNSIRGIVKNPCSLHLRINSTVPLALCHVYEIIIVKNHGHLKDAL